MRAKIQPKVATGQQLIRVLDRSTLQPMVVRTGTSKADFARRLVEAIADSGRAPTDRSRWRSWLAKTYGVSVETARKWLVGEAIPETERLATIALDLNTESVDYLLTGRRFEHVVAERNRINGDEFALLESYRRAPDDARTATRLILGLGNQPQPSSNVVRLQERRAMYDGGGSGPIDVATLTEILAQMERIDEGTPSKRAQVIAAIYDLVTEGKPKPTVASIRKLIRSA